MSPPDTTTRSLQKGSAELLVLAILDGPQRHGYEIAQLIDARSDGRLKFQAATLYPLLYKLEKRGCLEGRWVEKAAQRRRRFYRLTAATLALGIGATTIVYSHVTDTARLTNEFINTK